MENHKKVRSTKTEIGGREVNYA